MASINVPTWKNIDEAWAHSGLYMPQLKSIPTKTETITLSGCRPGIDEYDWLPNEDAKDIKNKLAENPMTWLFFSQSNKGTTLTARLLAEETDKNRAEAIWIYATTHDLLEYCAGRSNMSRPLSEIEHAAHLHLIEEYGSMPWHHAMRRLIPDIVIPHDIINNISCKTEKAELETAMGLIRINTMLLKSTYTIQHYIS